MFSSQFWTFSADNCKKIVWNQINELLNQDYWLWVNPSNATYKTKICWFCEYCYSYSPKSDADSTYKPPIYIHFGCALAGPRSARRTDIQDFRVWFFNKPAKNAMLHIVSIVLNQLKFEWLTKLNLVHETIQYMAG